MMEWKLCKCLKCGLVIGTERQGSLDIFADGRCPLCGGTADWRLINDLKLVKVEQPKEVTLSNPACENCKHEKTNSWDEPCLCCEPVCNERWSKFEPKQPESVILEQIERQCKNNSEMISGLSDVGAKFIATHCEQIAHDMRKFDKRIEQLEKELPKHQIFKVKHQNSCQTCKHNEKGVDEKPCVDCVRDDELSYYESMQIINETIEHHKKDVDNFHPESFDSYGKEWRIMSVDGDVLAKKTVTGIVFRFPDGSEKIFTYNGLFNGVLIGRCKDCESFDPFEVGASCQNSRGGKNPGPTFGCIEWKAKP